MNERLTRLAWMEDEVAQPKVAVADAGWLDDRAGLLLQVLAELGHERWVPAQRDEAEQARRDIHGACERWCVYHHS